MPSKPGSRRLLLITLASGGIGALLFAGVGMWLLSSAQLELIEHAEEGEAVGRGGLEHAIPRDIPIQGQRTAFVRISRNDERILFETLPEDLRRETHEIDIGSSMTVDLISSPSTALEVTALTEREQKLPDFGFAHWEWDVLAKEAGVHDLVLTVSLVVRDSRGNSDRRTVQVFRQEVTVLVADWDERAVGFFEEYWQWIIGTVLTIIGLVFAYIKLRRGGS